MDPVVHFELPAEDRDRMAAFYSTVFGWQTEPLGPEMGNYTVVTTTLTDSDGRPTTPGEINGGFYLKTDDPSSHAPSVVIAVDDIVKSVPRSYYQDEKIYREIAQGRTLFGSISILERTERSGSANIKNRNDANEYT